MKLLTTLQDDIILEVETTGEETREFDFPSRHIHYWYPFNLNFFYKYTNSKNFLYLVKDKNYEGPNYYGVDILKRTKPLDKKHGVMFHPAVYDRNMRIIFRARQLGIATIDSSFTTEDVQEGFNLLSMAIAMVKRSGEERYVAEIGEDDYPQPLMSEEWDEIIYSYLTEKEEEFLIEFGEIYCMLNLMRKLAEGR